MKNFQKKLAVMFIAVVSSVMLLASTAYEEDEPLRPEVKRLIGMKLPPEKNPGDIPGWVGLSGFGIKDEMYLDVLQKNEISIIAIKVINRKEKTTSILDAREIPGKFLRSYVENGKQKWRKNEKLWYRITKDCSREGSDNRELVIGMWKFEPNSKCTDPSSLVKKAWLLNLDNGRLNDIPTQGVSCREPDCGDNG